MNKFHPGFCGHWQLIAFIQARWQRLHSALSPRFAKYQPAVRLGNRRVEQRLLHRLAQTQAETTC